MAIALTEDGRAIEFYLVAKEADIKPIIGCEVYVAQDSRFGRNASDRNNYHLILLAKNRTGYRNLIQLAVHWDG